MRGEPKEVVAVGEYRIVRDAQQGQLFVEKQAGCNRMGAMQWKDVGIYEGELDALMGDNEERSILVRETQLLSDLVNEIERLRRAAHQYEESRGRPGP